MVPLKRRHRLIAWLSFLLVMVLGVLFGQLPGDTLLWGELQNTAHIPLFGLVAIATLCVLRELVPLLRDRPLVGYLLAGVASFTIGLLTEIAQLLTHRDASISDAMRDLAGTVVGLGLYASFDPRMQLFWRRQRRGLRAVTIVLSCVVFAVSLFPLVRLAAAYLQRSAAFPVIVDFRTSWSRAFLQCKSAVLAKVAAAESQVSVPDYLTTRLDLDPVPYSGVYVTEPYPDWHSFAYLTFDVYSPQRQPLWLVLRIHDALHNQAYSDRFNRRLEIRPGNNRFRIPLPAVEAAPAKREMDMSRIRGLGLFSTDLTRPTSFYLGTLRLE